MDPKDIKFSVVIPTYNRAHLVSRAIISALAQHKQPLEIIVVDDGSADNTAQVVTAFGPPVRYLHQPNGGSAKARDNGIRQAQSNWVALLDSDDMWLPTHLANMAHAIADTNGRASFYFADTIEPPEKGGKRLWEVLAFNIAGAYQFALDGTAWVVCDGRQPMMLQASVFSKAAYVAAGGFHPQLRYRDDTHLFMKLGITGPICAVAGCGAQMNGDDLPQNRLTLTYDVDKYLGASMHVILYQDLLATIPNLSPVLRKRFQIGLAAAHRRVARSVWKKGQWWAAIHHVGQSFRASPQSSLLHLPAAILHPSK